jgi:hypothetical protein
MFENELAQLRGLDDVADEAERKARRAAIQTTLRERAGADGKRTRDFLDAQNLCDPDERWNAIYLVEALAVATEPPIELLRWYFPRAAEKVSACPAPEATLTLTTFAFLEQSPSGAKTQLLPEYVKLADSKLVELRLAAIELFGGFTIATAATVRSALERLLHDSDWRVRQAAEALLAEESLLPPGYSTPWGDRIRRKLGSSR